MADGGFNTAKRLSSKYGATKSTAMVIGPLGKKTSASYYINKLKGIGLFDVSQACGIHLIKKGQRNPLKTTSRGVGELIEILIQKGCVEIIIGLGDTVTNDGGLGLLQALGCKAYDIDGIILPKTRFDIRKLKFLKLPDSPKIKITCLCDGIYTLYGKNGITLNAAKQKGADSFTIDILEEEMDNLAQIYSQHTKYDYSSIEKTGCAGGIASALLTLFDANLLMGAEVIIKEFKLLNKFEKFNLIISSEGEINFQSIGGKTPLVVSKYFQSIGIPTILMVAYKGIGYKEAYQNGVIGIIETDNKKLPFIELRKNKLGYEQIFTASYNMALKIFPKLFA